MTGKRRWRPYLAVAVVLLLSAGLWVWSNFREQGAGGQSLDSIADNADANPVKKSGFGMERRQALVGTFVAHESWSLLPMPSGTTTCSRGSFSCGCASATASVEVGIGALGVLFRGKNYSARPVELRADWPRRGKARDGAAYGKGR